MMLKLEALSVYYGGIHALRGINLEVPEGKIVALIGANGAGKSTMLNRIMGMVKGEGTVLWNGEDISAKDTKDIVSLGLVMIPEGRRIFPNLSVEENLLLGAYIRNDRNAVRRDREKCYALFPRLKERRNQNAGTLSGGEQQMLAVGRGLMSNPRLLMLDEPSLGLAPLMAGMIFKTLKDINAEGTTVLLIEQNAHAALDIADYGYVLETGAITMHDTCNALAGDDRIRKAYLGED
jgi:branched-chain amino acid transport system ATP-binding protein